MAGKAKSKSLARAKTESQSKGPKPGSTRKPRVVPEWDPETEFFMKTYRIAILDPDDTYTIDTLEVHNVPNYTWQDALQCYREEHPWLEPQALLAVVEES